MKELEIEFKNMLNYDTYARLRDTLFKNAEAITQTNFYIDTPDHQLIEQKVSLRIRDIKGRLVMTLKIPQEIGIMEYHDDISDALFDHEHITENDIPDSIKVQLSAYGVDLNQLRIIGALSTERRETRYQDGLLVLDASHYLDAEDYELEFEVRDYEPGLAQFEQFLIDYQITGQQTLNKVQRFYSRHNQLISK
ncbi:CYTH domain-containing protein [Macrococcus lamae]|uniref:CYTH domain-containing protein n=1 Tax=Macrococcus lamae TaxID=198484 RepID=UPI00140AD973|nr:CYTH domain-containing protein [Macrococcus lamae]